MSGSPVVAARFAVEVADVAPAGVEVLVGEVFADPRRGDGRGPVVFCLPGGGMTRGYFDLRPATGDDGYSMARHLASAGLVAVTLDHPGVGESDRPDDGYALTAQRVADVHAEARRRVLDRLTGGALVEGLDPWEATATVGLGHSAGASITVHQQSRHRSHDALVLLGFTGRGLPEHLEEAEATVAGDPEALHRRIADLVRARYGDPLPMQRRGSAGLLVGAPLPPPVHEALVACRTNLLALVGLASMVPGNADPELSHIDVPVFLGVGDRDIAEEPHAIPASLTSSSDLTLFVLDDAGHNHNVAPTRRRLWDRVAAWVTAVVGEGTGSGGEGRSGSQGRGAGGWRSHTPPPDPIV